MKLEDDGGLLQITGNATLTGANNKLVMAGIVPGIKLQKGDVIQIDGAGEINSKPRTVEGIINNGELSLNYEHCETRGNGPLKLQDFTGHVTITRLAKWHSASEGLGQDWVSLVGLRTVRLDTINSTNRTIQVSARIGNQSASQLTTITVNGVVAAPFANGGGTSNSQGAIAPVGIDAVYSVSNEQGGATIHSWSERR